VKHLHYEFEGWSGDELLASFPCFIVTKEMGAKLVDAGLSGFELAEVEISKSGLFLALHPKRDLPAFQWLRVLGDAGAADFGVTEGYDLVVSNGALRILREGRLAHCDVSELSNRGHS
jgi:hypothetical protein